MSIILLAMGLNTVPVELAGEFVAQFSLILSLPEIMVFAGTIFINDWLIYSTLITPFGAGLLLYMVAGALKGQLTHRNGVSSFEPFGGLALLAAFIFATVILLFLPMVLDRDGGLWEKAKKINDDAAREQKEKDEGVLATDLKIMKEVIEDTLCDTCI